MDNNFVPKRNKKLKENIERKKEFKEKSEELPKIYEKELRKKILFDYETNSDFKNIFDEIKKEKKEDKKILNLAQFKRFYDFAKKNDYDFFDEEDKVKKFIEKQLERKYAVKFYTFVWNEFYYQIPKNKLKNKIRIEKKKIGGFEVENLTIDSIRSIKANGTLKNEIKEEIRIKLKIFERYLLYILGTKRISDKLFNKIIMFLN